MLQGYEVMIASLGAVFSLFIVAYLVRFFPKEHSKKTAQH